MVLKEWKMLAVKTHTYPHIVLKKPLSLQYLYTRQAHSQEAQFIAL